MGFQTLFDAAFSVAKPRKLSEIAEAGSVGAAILTAGRHIYTGVCIDTACSLGFCAEHAAAAAMITAGDQQILQVIAVNSEGNILPPCGRCREFLTQLHPDNHLAKVWLSPDTAATLRELLPFDWKAVL